MKRYAFRNPLLPLRLLCLLLLALTLFAALSHTALAVQDEVQATPVHFAETAGTSITASVPASAADALMTVLPASDTYNGALIFALLVVACGCGVGILYIDHRGKSSEP